MLGIHVCQECLCPNAHELAMGQECLSPNAYVLTIEHVSSHIIPEHVYAITILFILDLRPGNINCQMFRHLGLGILSRHNITMK